MTFSPDSKLLAAGAGGRTVRLWDLGSRLPTERIHLEGQVGQAGPGHTTFETSEFWDYGSVAFSPDGKLLASADEEGQVIIWDPTARKQLHEWRLPGPVVQVLFAPDGQHLATVNGNGTVYILQWRH